MMTYIHNLYCAYFSNFSSIFSANVLFIKSSHKENAYKRLIPIISSRNTTYYYHNIAETKTVKLYFFTLHKQFSISSKMLSILFKGVLYPEMPEFYFL